MIHPARINDRRFRGSRRTEDVHIFMPPSAARSGMMIAHVVFVSRTLARVCVSSAGTTDANTPADRQTQT